MLLSGNFAELRNNHFHAGIDIKTPTEGLAVFAVEKGFVSRIKVGATGYGKAIYITHPNGLTTVYGHLQKFAPKIEAFVKKQQYEKKSFEIEIYPNNTEIQIDNKEIIAFSGNTGASAGPHLHFEIRDTKTQNILNPELFGYDFPDSIPPKILQLWGYAIDDFSAINNEQNSQQLFFTPQPNGEFIADTISAIGNIGFGMQIIDLKNFTKNSYGIYKATMSVNNQIILAYTFNEHRFANDHYINTFIDYSQFKNSGKRTQLFYKKQGNKLPFYTENGNGIIQVIENQNYWVSFILEDFKGNKTTLHIPIEGKKQTFSEKTPVVKNLIASRDNQYQTENTEVYFPENTFYENTSMQITENESILNIFPTNIPVSKSFLVRFKKKNDLPFSDLKKVFIASINPKTKEKSFIKTFQNKEYFSCDTKFLGNFTLTEDTTPPIIEPVNFSSETEINSLSELNIKILDDFSGIGSYQVFFNNNWILAQYEPKNKMLSVAVEELFFNSEEKNILKIIVSDKVQNQQVIEIPLLWKTSEIP